MLVLQGQAVRLVVDGGGKGFGCLKTPYFINNAGVLGLTLPKIFIVYQVLMRCGLQF